MQRSPRSVGVQVHHRSYWTHIITCDVGWRYYLADLNILFSAHLLNFKHTREHSQVFSMILQQASELWSSCESQSFTHFAKQILNEIYDLYEESLRWLVHKSSFFSARCEEKVSVSVIKRLTLAGNPNYDLLIWFLCCRGSKSRRCIFFFCLLLSFRPLCNEEQRTSSEAHSLNFLSRILV